ncbi:MAG TPA: hypothetical protein VJJ78_02450 [Candidatus Saccharimonadales bacterium]|nr:hypothetical protein [Candidatus Saccharimonadales bacterium]
MKNQRETLEESRDSWTESASHDRKQFLASFAITATGIVLVGIGIKTALSGDVSGGVLEMGVGGGLATTFGKMGLSEVQDFANMTAQTAVRQSQLDELIE